GRPRSSCTPRTAGFGATRWWRSWLLPVHVHRRSRAPTVRLVAFRSVRRGRADLLLESSPAERAQAELQQDRMIDRGLDRGIGRGRKAVRIIGDVTHGQCETLVDVAEPEPILIELGRADIVARGAEHGPVRRD